MKKQDIQYNIGGTYQDDRFPAALDPASVQLDGRTFEQLAQGFIHMAKSLNFFATDDLTPTNSWSPFFAQITGADGNLDLNKLRELEESGGMQPHLALLFAVLKAYAAQQQGINAISARHLDFYFRQILRFAPMPGSVGSVPVAVNLNKNAQSAYIPAGTKFLAGKDDLGKNITFCNNDAITAYPITVECVEAINSSETLSYKNENDEIDLTIPKRCGIAVTSPVLAVSGITSITFSTNVGNVAVYYTSAKGWEKTTVSNNIISSVSSIAPYNEDVHKLGIDTKHPVLFLAYTSIDQMLDAVTEIPQIGSVAATITGDSLTLQSKTGIVKNAQNALPFGSQPSKDDTCIALAPAVSGFTRGSYSIVSSNDLWNPKNTNVGVSGNTLKMNNDNGYAAYVRNLILATNDIAQNGENAQRTITASPTPHTLKSALSLKCTYTKNTGHSHPAFLATPSGISPLIANSDITVAFSHGINVYVGLKGATPGSSLCAYVQLDKSHNIQIPDDAMPPKWYVLEGNKWAPAAMLSNTTQDMLIDGFVKIDLSSDDIFAPHNVLPQNLVWLRIDYSTYERAMVTKIIPNAMPLQLDAQSAGTPVVGSPLPSGTISKPMGVIAGVKGVEQFCDGNPGTPAESDRDFIVRVSERLRHKGRAVTIWDYERLILQQFPSLAAVKGIPYSVSTAKELGWEKGTVAMVLVPKSITKGVLKPSISQSEKDAVKRFISARMPACANLLVLDPEYDEVRVECTLCLREGLSDIAQHKTMASQALTTYLSPWSDGETAMLLSQNYNESQILLFLERLPYVDNVRDLRVTLNGTLVPEGADIVPTKPISVLTASDKINITVITPNSAK